MTLSNCDQLLLRKPTHTEMTQVSIKASMGDPDCMEANLFVYAFRYALVDDEGEQLCESFDDAVAFVNSLAIEDFALIQAAVDQQTTLNDGDEAVEAGKAY